MDDVYGGLRLSNETKKVDQWLANNVGYMLFLGMWSRNFGMPAAVEQLKKKLLEDHILTESELEKVDMNFFTDGCIREAQAGLDNWGM